MTEKTIAPMILGSGRAGQAMAKVFSLIGLMDTDLTFAPVRWLKRDDDMAAALKSVHNPVLVISNPHNLHARAIKEADRSGARAIICEKPSCADLEQLATLQAVRTPTAILHVYRKMWGPETIKSMVTKDEMGAIIAVEGRYWQSSTAVRALDPGTKNAGAWKNDVNLSGSSDAFFDVGTHWLDMATYLMGQVPLQIHGWRSYANAEASHRDSHIQLSVDYPGGGRALGSISKTFHGAPNHFEINVVGERKSATWHFLNPDEILIGEGRQHRTLARSHDASTASCQPPHHGLGWLEGYLGITHALLRETFCGEAGVYPNLGENLAWMEKALQTKWQP